MPLSVFYFSTLETDRDIRNILCVIDHYSSIGKKKKDSASVRLPNSQHMASGSGIWEEVAGLEQSQANIPPAEGAAAVLI